MQYPDPRQFGIEERDVKLRQRLEEIVSNPFAWVGWISGWGIAFGVLAALFGQPGDVAFGGFGPLSVTQKRKQSSSCPSSKHRAILGQQTARGTAFWRLFRT